jgi:hypothetical protein
MSIVTQNVLPIEDISGLRPKIWVCVGTGYSREDIKAEVLARGGGFVADAVTTVQDIGVRIIEASFRNRITVLGPLGRQEVLRLLLAEKRISARMPELKRLRRQGNFFKRLDAAIQAGRMSFAHDIEEEVLLSTLEQKVGGNPIRPIQDEVRRLSQAYEAWLEASQRWDLPMVIQGATQVLVQRGWPPPLRKPKRVLHFSAQFQESRERGFWESLGALVPVEEVGPARWISPNPDLRWDWQRWHTIDDAAEALAESIAESGDFSSQFVLIPDHAPVRRSLARAFAKYGVPLADPRDPTRIRWDESIKWAMLPLEVVARNYERAKVVS